MRVVPLLLVVVPLITTSCRSRVAPEDVIAFSVDAFVGLRNVEARLTLTDDDGRHPDLFLDGIDGGIVVEAVDVPIGCQDNSCGGAIAVDVGTWNVEVVISALDRCGSRGDVLRYDGTFTVDHWQTAPLELAPSAGFDIDVDGVLDVLEATGCGRFDLADGIALPRSCDEGGEACCIDEAGLSGGQMTFAGRADHALPYDHDGVAGNDVVDVGEFVLDSTEFTWGALARCVAAGACLANEPEHPARIALVEGVDLATPAQGLSPVEAAAACAFFGRRLPKDSEWDFAAADRGAAPRARFPFDVDDDTAVGCTPEDPAPATAYRAAGRACGDGVPVRVGSFLTSGITRGVGTPVTELAGNVAEWTLIGGDVDDAEFVVLRGGGVGSFLELLENDLPLVFTVGADDARITAVSAVAGFRCAADVVDDTPVEPACPVSRFIR